MRTDFAPLGMTVITRNEIAATLGVCVVAAVQLLTVERLDPPLTAATYAFGVAIPTLAGLLLKMQNAPQPVGRADAIIMRVMKEVGIDSAYIGGLTCFLHFSSGAGLVYGVTISVVMLGNFRSRYGAGGCQTLAANGTEQAPLSVQARPAEVAVANGAGQVP